MDYPFQKAWVQPPPPPRKKIGEGVSVGEGAIVHRPVSDGYSISSCCLKTVNNKIPVSSVLMIVKDCAERLSAVASSVGLTIPRG